MSLLVDDEPCPPYEPCVCGGCEEFCEECRNPGLCVCGEKSADL